MKGIDQFGRYLWVMEEFFHFLKKSIKSQSYCSAILTRTVAVESTRRTNGKTRQDSSQGAVGARPQELLGSISGLTVKGSTTLLFSMQHSCQESFHRNRNNDKILCIHLTSVD